MNKFSDRSKMSRDSQESESTIAEEEAASSSGEEKSSPESDEESEEELEEPVLKYKRFAKNGILGIDHQNIICCVAVHPKVNDRWATNLMLLLVSRARLSRGESLACKTNKSMRLVWPARLCSYSLIVIVQAQLPSCATRQSESYPVVQPDGLKATRLYNRTV